MPRSRPWLKHWSKARHSTTLLSLSLAERGAWWNLVELGHDCDADGALVKADGIPLSIEEMLINCHIQSQKDDYSFRAMIEKLVNMGSLHWNDNHTLVITNYTEYQSLAPTATKEAVRERVRLWRASKHVTENSLPPLTTPLSTTTTRTEAEAEAECNGVTLVTCNDNAVTPEAIFEEICHYHEKNIGKIVPIFAESAWAFAQNFTGPVSWVHDAFSEAAAYNRVNWAYIRAILNRWSKEGKGSGRGKESGLRENRGHSGPGPRVVISDETGNGAPDED